MPPARVEVAPGFAGAELRGFFDSLRPPGARVSCGFRTFKKLVVRLVSGRDRNASQLLST
jgi:hypothetical protein